MRASWPVVRRLVVCSAVALLLPWISLRGQTPQDTGLRSPGQVIDSLAEPGQSLAVRGTSPRSGLVTFASTAGNGLLVPQPETAPALDRALSFVDLYGGRKPYIVSTMDNGAGSTVALGYRCSTLFYLEDKTAGRPWITKLPFPVQCVARVETREAVTNSLFVTTYRYRHGYYDRDDREFRGFACVEETDSESYDHLAGAGAEARDLGRKQALQRRGVALRDAIVTSQPHSGTQLGRALRRVREPYDRLIVITDEQSHDRVPAPETPGYVINVASARNGVGYGAWTHIDGWSEAVVDYVRNLESTAKQN